MITPDPSDRHWWLIPGMENVGIGRKTERDFAGRGISYPFVHASHIVLREETTPERLWIASIESSSYAIDPYATGPVVRMSRGGATAAEAYGRIVESLFDQGWTVR